MMIQSISVTRRITISPKEHIDITIGCEDDSQSYDEIYDHIKMKLIEAETDYSVMYGLKDPSEYKSAKRKKKR